jgi:2-phospho-L-lactate/phosphoenolpyruvate guanylyltransferase
MCDGTYAVIPVKPFAFAKQRLAPILNNAERFRLARVMLGDVLDSVSATRKLAGFCVVTCDASVASMVDAYGGRVVHEAGAFGLDAAIGTALNALAGIASGVMVIPADIPHVTADVIDTVARNTADRGVTLVPALYDGGTNVLSLRPISVIPPRYGPGSFERHCRAALQAGAATHVHVCNVTGYDLDRPEDLETFLAFGSPTRTHDYLVGLGVGERAARERRGSAPAARARASA